LSIDIIRTFESLLQSEENEVIEFKKAGTSYDFEKLGKYFSALSNEANLKNKKEAWLVFGIEDKTKKILGSNYKGNGGLHELKKNLADNINNRLTFIEIYEISYENKRVILFQIPSGLKGIPTTFKGHTYARDHESLVPLNLEEFDRIRSQVDKKDWSVEIVHSASIVDLDQNAIKLARVQFELKFGHKYPDLNQWTDDKFLDKAKITVKGKITRAALVLLGKEESEHFLNPATSKIRWVLKDKTGETIDYEIISMPMILALDKLNAKIRNLRYRRIIEGDESLFPEEIDTYDQFTIREAINNCIAHQDYTLHGRINVIEKDDSLTFTNKGAFIPGSVEKVVIEDSPEEEYRNSFLANAMFHINMVDTAGGGIRKMFDKQIARFFPLPEYDLSDSKVSVTITGRVLDLEYANILVKMTSLSLKDIMLLDKVQKNKPIDDGELKYLRKNSLVEGRKNNIYLSKNVAQKSGQKARYTKVSGFDKQYYLDLIIKGLDDHKNMNRKEIDELLWEKLPESLNDGQKKNKVMNLISELRKSGRIINTGSDTKSNWKLT